MRGAGAVIGANVETDPVTLAGLPCRLPDDLNWGHMLGAGILGGIGFTMSIFITYPAFADDPAAINASKMAIFLASMVSGTVRFLF